MDQTKDSDKRSSLVIRVISGLVGIILFLAVLFFNASFPILINIFVSLICVLAVHEVFNVIDVKKKLLITISTLIFASVLPLFGFGIVWYASWYMYTVIVFLNLIKSNEIFNLRDILSIYAMTMLITFSMRLIVEVRDFNSTLGSLYVCYALSVAWLSDTGAYFFGSYFGKNKLCPHISPKKTVEGVVGGILLCTIGSVLIFYVFSKFIFLDQIQPNYLIVTIVSTTGSIISVFGDLVFSAIKRGYKVKDFGNIMPGHGGILDRFDSVIFVVPYIFICMNIFNFIY